MTALDAGLPEITDDAAGDGVLPPPSPRDASRSQRAKDLFVELWRDKAGFLGALYLTVLVVAAVFAPLLAPHDPRDQDIVNRLQPPVWSGGEWANVLGTDGLGRDVLSRLIYGARVSLFIGLAVPVVAGLVGVLLGLVAGYRGGRTDRIIMRVVDTQIAFPGLLIAILLASLIGPSIRTVVIVLSVNGWMIYARMTRGVVLSVRETAYVEAAEIVGCRSKRVMLKHILPNLAAPISTLAVLEFARIVLAEAALSFLGFGTPPPAASWGELLAQAHANDLRWWLLAPAGSCVVGLAAALGALGRGR